MRKVALIVVVVLLAVAVVPVAFANGNGPTVTRFVDQPFGYFQCVPMDDHFSDIPSYFQDLVEDPEGGGVCLQYDATWSQTLSVKPNGDVAWTTNTVGTVTFYDNTDGDIEFPENVSEDTLILTAHYKGDEVGRDLGGDAFCLRPDDPVEWGDIAGSASAEETSCWEHWGTEEGQDATLDFLEMHQKIEYEGDLIVYYHVAIHGAGDWCISSKDTTPWGTNCPAQNDEE